MSGFRTYTVSLVASATQDLALGAKFEGPMHQSIGGAPSPYLSDLTAGDDGADSHFLYGRDEIWVGSIYERDDAEGLAAAFVIPASTSLDAYTAPLAQITTDDPSSVYYEITLINGDGDLVLRGFLVPEPATVMLTALFFLTTPIRLRGRVRA